VELFAGVELFFEFTSTVRLPRGGQSLLGRVPLDFYTNGFKESIITNNAHLSGNNPQIDFSIPAQRVMEALGSTYNNENFVLLLRCLNGLKARVSTKRYTRLHH